MNYCETLMVATIKDSSQTNCVIGKRNLKPLCYFYKLVGTFLPIDLTNKNKLTKMPYRSMKVINEFKVTVKK